MPGKNATARSQGVRKEHKDNAEDREDTLTDTLTITADNDTAINGYSDEARRLQEELKTLKKNFERLDGLFQDSLEEVNQVRSEYEGKLIKANENYRAVKAENEELKERVDILFKLGRSYINRKENDEIQSDKKKENDPTARKPEGEIILLMRVLKSITYYLGVFSDCFF